MRLKWPPSPARSMVIVLLAAVLAGCGVLQPTPARFRPPLPEAQPMPDLQAEDVVAQLELLGFACWFDPGGDIPSGWNCGRGDQEGGDYLNVALASAETGPIEWVSAYRQIQLGPDTGPAPDVLDRAGATSFHESVIELIIPEGQRPTERGMLAGVQSNYPVDLGGGWFLSFDRNALSRSMSVVYADGAKLVLPDE